MARKNDRSLVKSAEKDSTWQDILDQFLNMRRHDENLFVFIDGLSLEEEQWMVKINY